MLEKVGALVTEKTTEVLKEYGLDKANPGKIFGGGKMPADRAAKMEYLKGILADNDRAVYEAKATETEKTKFLSDARMAYMIKNLVSFTITKDPDYLKHVKALAEGVNADGGYLTPPEFRANLIEDLLDKSFLRSMVTVIPMGSDSLEMPTLVNSVKVTWGSENTAISTTTAAFGTLTFAPKRLNTMLYTSRELVNDSAIGIIQLISRLFVEAIGREEDRVIINGSGNGQPKGILAETIAGIDNANVDANIADNIKKLPWRLNQAYRQNAVWLASKLALEQIVTLKTTTNEYLFKQGIEGGAPATIAGLPFKEQNDMPVDTLLLGDLRQYYLADREQVSIETTTEGAGTFEKHQVAIKVVERIDGKVALTNAFRTITNCGFD